MVNPGPPSPLRISFPGCDSPHGKASMSIKSRSFDDGLIMNGFEDGQLLDIVGSSGGLLKPLLPSIPSLKPLIGP
ncbi:hypothetical protein BPOR_0570g00030 [Botrytis porri]|uniref:Uncharacterized protein n=1 Tax=Botrytis porri TaxID=87229 RepID=A0A4Z1KES1_9HELO|nr:hypothetical protein BPOR_0570g00030 [Botrytis porri]